MIRRARGSLLGLCALLLTAQACTIHFTPKPIPPAFPGDVTPPADILPLSGSELEYQPYLWNDSGRIQGSTNCYAYMLDMREGFPPGHKLQPGELSGQPLSSLSDVTTARIIELVIADARMEGFTFYAVSRDTACAVGTYKAALVVDPFRDYHWYRQNPDGSWSHKPGHTAVTNRDASGQLIWDPERANRNYGSINYSDFGGYFCVGR